MANSSVIPQSESAAIITVEGLDQYWETFSGINDSSNASDEYSDGITNRLYKIEGPRSLDEMEISKAFDRKADKSIIEFWLTRKQGREPVKAVTVTLVDYSPEAQPDEAFILYGVRPTSIQVANVDKKSNNVMRLTMRFIADDWKYA